MKALIKLVVGLAVALAVFVWGADRCERARQGREARELGERQEKMRAEETRAKLIAAPPESYSPDEGLVVPELNRQAEHRFRQIAEKHRVEVLEYRPVAWREVVVTLQTRSQTGIGDLLREAILEDIIWNFDEVMQEQNSTMYYEQGTAARIWQTRFTMQIEMP